MSSKVLPLPHANPGASSPQPPRSLGEHGMKLWRSVHAEYAVTDIAGMEMLAQACTALDRAEALAAEIAADGSVIRDRERGIVKDHPGLKHELANRAFVVRTLSKLGLNFEPLRSERGRPPGDFTV
jgi:phage terminase small subunit